MSRWRKSIVVFLVLLAGIPPATVTGAENEKKETTEAATSAVSNTLISDVETTASLAGSNGTTTTEQTPESFHYNKPNGDLDMIPSPDEIHRQQIRDALNAQWRMEQRAAFGSSLEVPWSIPASGESSALTQTPPVPAASPGRLRTVSKKKFPSSYVLTAGTVIPALLLTGLNSDLPGYLTAQVSEPVYDSPTGRHILIPQGTRLFGEYDSKVIFGQRRPLVKWSRLIFPDGSTLDLENMPGVDKAGYSGFQARVDSHFGPILGTAVLASVFAGIADNLDDDTESQITITQPRITLSDSVPVGTVVLKAGDPPTGWFICDGREISQSTAPELYAMLDAGKLPNMPPQFGLRWMIKGISSQSSILDIIAGSGWSSSNAVIRDETGREIGSELADVISDMASQVLQKHLDRAPTLTVKQGYRFSVIVNREIRLPSYSY